MLNNRILNNTLANNIILGKGLGPLRFGMYPKEVQPIIGRGCVFEMPQEDADPEALIHHYPHLGIDLTFDVEDEQRLTYIDIFDGPYIIMNSLALGMRCAQAKEQLRAMGLGKFQEEVLKEWQLLCCHAHSLVLWFQNHRLEKITFGHYWSKEGNPLWPDT